MALVRPLEPVSMFVCLACQVSSTRRLAMALLQHECHRLTDRIRSDPRVPAHGRNCESGPAPDSRRSRPAIPTLRRGGRTSVGSDLCLLGDLKGVIDLDAEVPDGRFQPMDFST
jgi:hypothetical protein